MSEVSLSLPGKQVTVFVANRTKLAFQPELEFWKTHFLTVSLMVLKAFPNEIVGDSNVIF